MRNLCSLILTCLFAVSSLLTTAAVDVFSDRRIADPSAYENSGSFVMSTCTATFVNEGNTNRVLWRYSGGDWDNETSINSGQSVNKTVSDGETWQIWNTGDDALIQEWTMNCAGGSPQYAFGNGNNGDCCQSHGDHDHISGLFLRYVGPESPATIQFETDGYSNTSYTGVHSFDDYIFIEADDRFGTNSEMAYNGNWFDVHTSCSQPTNTGMGISSDGDFVSNPNPNASNIIFIIEGIATAEDGWCGITSPPSDLCGTLDGVYIYDQSTDTSVYGPIQDNDQINIADLPNEYYLLALTSGNIESTAWLVDGESLIENAIPFTFPNSGSNWNAGIGSYHVNVTAYINDGAAGEDCAMLDFDFSIVQTECVTIENGSSPYTADDNCFITVIENDSYCCNTWWDDICQENYTDCSTSGNPIETCLVAGYSSENGRVFWLPDFATDLKASASGLSFTKYDDGTALISGTVESIANSSNGFTVNVWYNNLSTYSDWVASGGDVKNPELGDEQSWIFYSLDESKSSALIGFGDWNGEALLVEKQNDNEYGLQIGDGANALNTNDNGMSMWFDYSGTSTGHGDINGTENCDDVVPDVNEFVLICADGLKVSVQGIGMEDESCAALSTGNNAGDLEFIILEAVWKGSNPPANVTFTAGGIDYLAAAQVVVEGNGSDNGNKRAYRAEVPAASSVSVCVPSGSNNNLRSFVAYEFSSNAGATSTGGGEFVGRHLYNSSYTMTLPIEASDAPRDVVITLPLSDMSEDGRNADFQITAGTLSKHYTITGNTNGLSLNLTPFILEDVAGDVTSIQIELISDPSNNPSSFLAAGLAIADAQCETPGEDDICEVLGYNGQDQRHFWFGSDFGHDWVSDADGLKFTQYDDGTARISGDIYRISNPDKQFEVVIYFNDKSDYNQWIGMDMEAKLCGDATIADAQDWTYWSFDESRPSVLTGRGDLTGEYLFISPSIGGEEFGLQLGSNGANCKNDDYGFSAWFSYTGTHTGNGDINATTICTTPQCEVECPVDITLDCENSIDPSSTGYPTLVCENNAGCLRDAGEFDFELQEWGGATAGWSFGTGWNVGTGCDPACGDIPNVFIDYTDFHTAYNTKLKSPMYDACCTDNVYLNFCMQQDLYGEEDVPGYLAVEYRINGGAWAQLAEYQNAFGETVNYNDTFEIPGAGGQQFEVRFRANGEGSTEFTMGGFGIDDVRVYGQSSGCSGPSEVEVDWTYTDSAAGTCPEVITRSFSSEYNGEAITCEQTITLIDEETPIFNSTPDDATFTCAEGIAASSATAIDNCDDNVSVTQSDEIIGGYCSYMIERTFVATDACGNATSYTQTINIIEDEPTVIVSSTNDNCTQGEGSITFEFEDSACRTGINLSIDGGANFTNVPDNSGSYTFSGVLAGIYDLQVKWGNGECFNDIEDVTIIDNNEIELEIKNLGNCIVDLYEWLIGGDQFIIQLLPGESIIVTTHVGAMWRIVGEDWNLANFDEQYTVEGCFDQVWNVAPDYCNPDCELEVEIEADPGLTICEGEEITLTAVASGETVCDEIIACYTMNNATDAGCVGTQGTGIVWQRAAGCQGSHTIWESGGDMKLTEYADNTARITGTITNNGQVGIVDVVLYDKANDGNTWNASCYLNGISGSESYYTSFLGTITVDGTEYTVEEKVSEMHFILAQGAGFDSNNFGVGGWSAGTWGGCTEWFSNLTPCEITSLETTYVWSTGETTETIMVSEAGTYSVTVTDCAGCVAEDEITIAVQEIPVLVGEEPMDLTINCDEAIPAVPVVTFADNLLSEVLVTFTEVNNDLNCGSEIIRTWIGSNDCGSSASVDQVITIIDTEGPIITFQTPNQTIECDEEVPEINVTFIDNCDNDLTVIVDNWVNDLDCGYEYVKWCQATDDCGQSAEATVTITVLDTTAPVVVSAPADVTLECDQPEPNEMPVFEDNCDALLELSAISSIALIECGYEVNRTWTASDDCGNEVSVSQKITFLDTTPPFFSVLPADYDVNCDNGSSDPEFAGMPEATDNCDDSVEITYSDGEAGEDCPATFERTWRATDDCGNFVEFIQNISINDFIAPVLSIPADVTIECDESTDPSNTGMASAEDDCSVPGVSFVDGPMTGDCPYTIERTWTAVDPCGNATLGVQTITIDDMLAPVASGIGVEMVINCDEDVPESEITFTDNCDTNIEVTVTTSLEPFGCLYKFFQTLTATDDCGNATSITNVYTVVDEVAPELFGVPSDTTIDCDAEVQSAIVFATDNCDDDVPVALTASTNYFNCGYEIVRTWTAIDDCGNTVSVSQTITVVDTTAPVLEGVPANVTVQCSDIPAIADVTATDNCDDAPVVSFNETNTGGCPYTLVRTWTATDICGNQSSMYQVLTVIDNVDPVLLGVPADFSGECGLAPAPGTVVATDNCDEDVTVTMIEETVGDSCPLTIIRTWTATDNCGNSVSDSQTITINDDTAPEFTAGPADETVECDLVMGPDFDAIQVEDNCDMNPLVTYSEAIIPGEILVEGAEPCGYDIIRTWTATDLCDNASTYIQTVTVVDTTDPVLMGVPADVNVDCTDVPSAPVVTAMDNCYDGQMNVMFTETSAPLTCGYEITRTWTVQDNCLNTASATQVITVVDVTAPEVVSTPADVTIQCDEDLPTSNAAFMDACDDVLSVVINDNEVDQDCGYYIIRTWTATDDCGNEVSTSQTIFVTDTIDPVLIGVPANATVECSNIPAAPMVTATDNCEINLVPTMEEEVISGECPYTIERTWTVSDECGNTTSETQILTVTDTIHPVIVSAPADVTIECDQPEPTEVPVFSDNCDDELELSAISSIAITDCGYVINRTWFAIDDCGNETSVSQMITVIDTAAPVVLTSPSDLDLECDENIPMVAPTFEDNCDEAIEVDFTEETTAGNCENAYTIERTWVAMDDCGNDVTVTQTITVTDTTDPVLVGVPANTVVQCDAIPSEANVTATDNCDLQVSVIFEESIEELACGSIITRSWTATDNCGNTDSAAQVINVIDTTDPIAEFVPAMITVECDEEIQDATPIFSDNCDDELTIVPSESIEELECGSMITRSWTATDHCGNAVTVSQIINIVDVTAPVVVSAPVDVTIQCDQPEPTEVPVFSDNCDDELELSAISSIAVTDCGYVINRTWFAIDDCGNETSVSQTITVVDITDPELIGVPANVTAECDNVPSAAEVTATDNCTDNMEVFFAEGFEPMECGYVLTRIWSATDNCGNTTSETQIVTVVDTVSPVVVSAPADVTIECDQPEPTEIPVFSDNCDSDLLLEAISSISIADCGYVINRTWFATDDCGNTTSVSQTITVVDTTAPVIIDGPANVTVQCDAVPGNGTLDVEDNCDELVNVEVVDSNEDIECGYIITRVYTATDDCGNSATHTQVITVTDTEAPAILGVPADVMIECGDAIPAPGDVDVEDNCDPMPMVTSSEMMEDLECGYQIIRTYIATDECGNEATATQTITVSDFTAPVFDNVPEDITVNCDEVTIAPSLSATDNCDDMVQVTLEEVIGEGCPYTITRTWTATDECGNTATVDQMVTVIDEVAPVFDEFPIFISVECDLVEDYTITATDNCGPVVVIIIEELLFSGGCYGTLQRTYEATDLCGNSVIATQLVQIVDTTAPELFNVPADVELVCGEDIPAIAEDIFATDNCTADVEIEFEEVQSNEFCPYTITRTWTATDICGNVTEGVQVIYVTVEVPDQVALVSYPNPFNDKFTVEFSVPRDAEVIACIYDVTGREVMPIYKGEADARRLYSFQCNNVNWEAGTYILMVTVGDDVYHHKMIVTQKQ